VRRVLLVLLRVGRGQERQHAATRLRGYAATRLRRRGGGTVVRCAAAAATVGHLAASTDRCWCPLPQCGCATAAVPAVPPAGRPAASQGRRPGRPGPGQAPARPLPQGGWGASLQGCWARSITGRPIRPLQGWPDPVRGRAAEEGDLPLPVGGGEAAT